VALVLLTAGAFAGKAWADLADLADPLVGPLRSQRSDLQPYGNDRLGDQPKAGVVVAGMPAHQLVGLID